MTLIDSISNMIEKVVIKYAIIIDNGVILKSTISESNILKIINFLPNLSEQLEPHSYIHSGKIYIYRITNHLLIILLTDLESRIIEHLISELDDRYSIRIEKEIETNPRTLKSIIKFIVFSMERSRGPEPLIWIPEEMDEKFAFKIAIKSLLNLTDEINGANKKKMLAFQPLTENENLIITYLFQIPFKKARGGSYDSAISILSEYKERAVIYKNYNIIEQILDKVSDKLIKIFQENIDETGEKINVLLFRDELNSIINSFDSIPMNISKTDIVIEEMMDALKELKEI